MPKTVFHPGNLAVEVEAGETLFNAAHKAGLPVASSCIGQGACGKCFMQIVKGEENLSPKEALELRLLARDKRAPNERISCQTKILGDCEATTKYW